MRGCSFSPTIPDTQKILSAPATPGNVPVFCAGGGECMWGREKAQRAASRTFFFFFPDIHASWQLLIWFKISVCVMVGTAVSSSFLLHHSHFGQYCIAFPFKETSISPIYKPQVHFFVRPELPPSSINCFLSHRNQAAPLTHSFIMCQDISNPNLLTTALPPSCRTGAIT